MRQSFCKRTLALLLVTILSMLFIMPVWADEENSEDFWFEYMDWGEGSAFPKGIHIRGYRGTDSDVTIPSHIGGKPVVGIYEKAFADSTTLTSVTIPGTIIYIHQNAFSGCTNLASVSMADGLTTIANQAFEG